MNRMQRNTIRKKRRRYLLLYSLFCFSVFLSGVLVTNDVMMKVTASSEAVNTLSFSYLGQVICNYISELNVGGWIYKLAVNLQNVIDMLFENISQLINALRI